MIKRLAVILVLLCCAVAQQPYYFSPIPHGSQSARGSIAVNEGAFGLDAKRQDGALKVNTVVPGSPAEKSDLRVGDVITSIDGKATASLSVGVFHDLLRSRPGDSFKITYLRGTQEQTVTLTAAPRLFVYPAEATLPPAVTQSVFDDWDVTVLLAQAPSTPNGMSLWVRVASESDSQIMNLNVEKFFILDSTSQQLTEVTGDQMKYVIQYWVAQNWRGGTYVAPRPPAQKSYRITGTENGTYTITDVGGGTSMISGSSTGSYTVTPEPDYTQLGSALGLAIRQWRDRKHDKKLLEEAQKQIANIDQVSFKAAAPLLPGEVRQGWIAYWTGSPRAVTPPFKVILFFAQPGTTNDKTLTFDFQ